MTLERTFWCTSTGIHIHSKISKCKSNNHRFLKHISHFYCSLFESKGCNDWVSLQLNFAMQSPRKERAGWNDVFCFFTTMYPRKHRIFQMYTWKSKIWVNFCTHPPFSSDLAPSDFIFFCFIIRKKSLLRNNYAVMEEVKIKKSKNEMAEVYQASKSL